MFQSTFHGISKIANSISKLANVIGTLVVLGLVIIINYDVFARGLFNSPFRGAVEVVQFSMVLIVFLQLPDVVRVGRLTRSDGMLLLLEHKVPKVARVIHFFINLLSAAVMSLIVLAMFPEFIEMWESKDYFGIPGVFTAPWWPIKLIILGSAALCTVLFILKILIPKAGGSK
ncbi:TRAP transporter small permease [Leucothrix arctica]|uniref:TRAP transporter small permease protein n=1 Tax=Leucothrix arctica TaxID=1481894 RepID=A0A317C7X4_9GAMM|nr:TRAP transporter small permease [Leucothrix arctica]PWQ94706.1 hypothetical protein DKT75_15565 [Leucothrix arctica]